MNETLRRQYQWLQVLVYHLQLPEWLLAEQIDRQEAYTLVVNFAVDFGLDPRDRDLLPKFAEKLSQALSEKAGPNLPANLKELVRFYQEHLDETRTASLKKAFPSLDEQIKALQRQYALKIQEELKNSVKELNQNPFLAEEVSHNLALRTALQLPPIFIKATFDEAVTPEEYQALVEEITNQELQRAGIKPPAKPVFKNIAKKTQEEAGFLATTKRTTTPRGEPIKKPSKEKKEVLETAEPEEEIPLPQIELSDRPYIKLKPRPDKAKIALIEKTQAFIEKAALVPVVKPIQVLTHTAPEKFREQHKTFVLAASGITPILVDNTLDYLNRESPASPELPYWQSLKAAFEKEKPPLLSLFERYYTWNRLGKVATKIEILGTNLFIRIISFGRSQNFTNLKIVLWKVFKSAKIGDFFGRLASKALISLTKVPEFLGLAGKPTAIPTPKEIILRTERIPSAVRTLGIGVPVRAPLGGILGLPGGVIKAVGGRFELFFLGGIRSFQRNITELGKISTRFASGFGTFFGNLSRVSPGNSIILSIGGAFVGLMFVTLFIVTNMGGAFMLPAGPIEEGEEVPPPAVPPEVPPPPGLDFRWPVDTPTYCSSNYGHRELTLENGQRICDYHEGIDIPANWNTPVHATTKGEVYATGSDNGYGVYVVVKHDENFYSLYAHLLAVSVSPGEKVDGLSILGYVDDTGRSYGTHLHFGFSTCGEVPGCFSRTTSGSQTPDPCSYLSNVNPGCSANCGYRDKETGCPGL